MPNLPTLLRPGALMLAVCSAGTAATAAPPPAWPEAARVRAGAPNVVVVLLDDVGFGAAATFGGPAQTPVLSQLAADGLRFNQFHTTALSSPTRAALLTGRNHHQVGFGTITEGANNNPGYTSLWNPATASVARVLQQQGYTTAGFGKWHNTPTWETGAAGPFEHWPARLGFDYYYGFHGGETSQYEPRLFRNSQLVEPPARPEQGYHVTTDLVDDSIRWLHNLQSATPDRPYFLYFATGAIHAPHHVPPEWIAKYRGQFDRGWDVLRAEIYARQKQLGVIPAGAELTPRPPELPAWDSLSADQKRLLARQMEVYAAFLEHTDHELGRLLAAVRQGPHGDNTLVFFIVGDNGASPEGGLNGSDHNVASFFLGVPDRLEDMLKNIDKLGGPEFDNHFATPWAWATDAPFQWTKQVASHLGGVRNPLVVSWPARIKGAGGLRSQFSHVNDIAPTIYDAAGIRPPARVDGVAQLPLEGRSLVYSFDQPQAPSRHRLQYFEMLGNRALYKDGWIAAARHGLPWAEGRLRNNDFGADRWELYHLDDDYSEAHDLAARYPARLAALKQEFEREARRNRVYPLNSVVAVVDPTKDTRPSLTRGRQEFVYPGGVDRIPLSQAPLLLTSHRISAELVVPAAGAEGVIVAEGGVGGGFSLYVQGDRVIYEHSFFGKRRDVLTSTLTLPRGPVRVEFDFDQDGKQAGAGGSARLAINGQPAGEIRLARIGFPEPLESLDIGRDSGSRVSPAYADAYGFTGTVARVTFQIK
jgi:arylsulfatase